MNVTGKIILEINSGNLGSTGTIMRGIAAESEKAGFVVYQAYPKIKGSEISLNTDIIITSDFFRKVNRKLAYYTGLNGCFSIFSTFRFLNKIKKLHPNIIHFHNLHNSYINLPMLFHFIKKYKISTLWTLHDCWAFTGQCAHFTLAKCNKWETGCHHCTQKYAYPASCIDRTKLMWKLKKRWFTSIEDMTIVTPSQWLEELVKKSFLKDYPVKVINNGINLSIFKPTKSFFREKYQCQNKYLILGVAFGWGKKKGLDVFIELCKRLNVEKYQIVLVGTNDKVDNLLPPEIISLHRTQNQWELAEIYTTADLFVNPTREENYPTTNMEALACGTPVLTFRTGGSPEILNETCGSVVDCDDINALEKEIIRICESSPYESKTCIKYANRFASNKKYLEYINLYKQYD